MESSDNMSLLSHLKNNMELVETLLQFGKVTILIEIMIQSILLSALIYLFCVDGIN
jgi:hypothetical protein